jgi:hypothetical protein
VSFTSRTGGSDDCVGVCACAATKWLITSTHTTLPARRSRQLPSRRRVPVRMLMIA